MDLPVSLRSLPGVQTPVPTQEPGGIRPPSGGPAPTGPSALEYEGTSPSRASGDRNRILQEDYTVDVKNNPGTAAALKKAGMPTDPRGLANVSNLATRYPAEFTALVDASRLVTASMGKNPAAQQQFAAAMDAFVKASGMPANQLGDLNYLLMRIATTEANNDAGDIRKRLSQQIEGNAKLIQTMKAYEESLTRALDTAQQSGKGEVAVVESDFRLNADNQVEQVADAQPEAGTKEVPGSDDGTKVGGPVEGLNVQPGGGEHTKVAAGDVPGVPMSESSRPHTVMMNQRQIMAEIRETRAQIQALENANKSLQEQLRSSNPKPPTVDETLPWFLDAEGRGPQDPARP